MPSFASLATLALTLFSASSALASGFGSAEADLVARDSGSVFEKRWNNHGKQCSPHKKNWCKTDAVHGYAWCGASGKHHTCQWACNKGWKKHGDKCIRHHEHKPATCKHHHHCSTWVKHAWAYCDSGKCTYECDKGYHSEKGACVKNSEHHKCGKHTCPTVQGGYSKCSKSGKCEQYCDTHNGGKLYTNKHKTAYKCINIKNDKNNCGKPGHVCPWGYHHKGEPVCWNGECTLNCHGYKVAKTHSGVHYCSHRKA